ncbi:MAG: alanine racemase [Desulfuromonadales bacterium]
MPKYCESTSLRHNAQSARPTLAQINLSALQHNYQVLRDSVPKDVRMMAVVKADAYGHGCVEISLELARLGAEAFAVTSLAEAIVLRESGIVQPVLVLGGLYPGEEADCIMNGVSATVFSIDQAIHLDRVAGTLSKKASIHIKIDTGMSRLGVSQEMVESFFNELKTLENLAVDGIYSQLATAGETSETGTICTRRQVELFREFVNCAKNNNLFPRDIHLANSAATFSCSLPFCTMIRPGIALYGALPFPELRSRIHLKPVMQFKTKIAAIHWTEKGEYVGYSGRYKAERKILVACVPVGYGDGYPRTLTNTGKALIGGKWAYVIGSICMDWSMLDVTDLENVQVGDEVVLFGVEDAGGDIQPDEFAVLAGTIPNAIFTGISKRVPRVYVRND